MVHFVGAGPGGPDLITLRGAELLQQADCVVYAGSLVNPALLGFVREGVPVYNSAHMTLEQVLEVLEQAERAGGNTVRLHTGDPCLYGAVREQMDQLDRRGIPWDVTPGVSSFCGAAAAAGVEYTLPGVSQSVIITRMAGRTPVPEREAIASLFPILSQNSAEPVVRGNGSTSRMLAMPVRYITSRSKPMPKPACLLPPKRRRSKYHQ